MSGTHKEHFLHVHHGLEPLIRPVVHGASHLTWGPGGAAYAVDEEGVVHKVHPALGTEVFAETGPVVGLGGDRQRVVAFHAGARVHFYDRAGTDLGSAPHRFVGPAEVTVQGDQTVAYGPTEDGPQVWAYDGTRPTQRVELPAGAMARPTDDGDIELLWASDAGLESIRVGGGGRFAGTRGAPMRLRQAGARLVGVSRELLAVFAAEGKPVLSPVEGTTCVVGTPDGTIIVGTNNGELLVLKPGLEDHPIRVRAHDEPVSALAVDRKGGLVASAAASLVLWGLDP